MVVVRLTGIVHTLPGDALNEGPNSGSNDRNNSRI